MGKHPTTGPVDSLVFDERLRPTKHRVLAPLVDSVVHVPPVVLTVLGLVLGLVAALAAALTLWWPALLLFAGNRIADGLDGEVARAGSTATDRGGYDDIVVDTVVYSAIPIGAAAGSDLDHIWIVVSLLLASFYVNTVTWTYLSALFEKRGSSGSQFTAVAMPVGLVEGTETVVFFALMLAIPSRLDWIMGAMAAAVSLGALLRFSVGRRRLIDSAARRPRVDS